MQITRQHSKLTALARIAPFLLIAACLAVLLVFVLLAQYAHPSSDDFCMAAGVNQHGLLDYLWRHYLEWSGRYSGNALYAIYPLMFDLFDGYKFIPVIVIVALFLATALLLSTLFKTRVYSRYVLLASLCFVCIYLLGMISPASGLYWMAGAFTYQAANVLVLVMLALMIHLADRQKHVKIVFSVIALLLLVVIIAIGTNETSMLAVTGAALLGFLIHLRSGWAVLKPWFVILVVTLICFAIVYFSPGNAIRAADFPLRHDLMRSINGSLSVGLKGLWIWISSPVLIISSVLATFAIARLYQDSGRTITVKRRHIVALVLFTLAIPFVFQFPAWWSMGGWPPARTLDAVYFLFLLSWFLTVGAVTLRYICADKCNLAMQPQHPLSVVVLLVLAGLFTAAVLQNKTYTQAETDLFHHAVPFDDYMNARYAVIEAAAANGRRYLVVPDYQREYPRSIYFNDIMRNPDHWRNVCYADYFGLERIRRQ